VGDPRRGNNAPDCDFRNVNENSECGALSDRAFGQPRITTTFSDDVLRGWGVRDSNWQGSVSFQHELRPGLSVDVGYFRTSHQNFRRDDNVLVGPTDFDEYCVTAPADARLPGGGGNQICGLYDIRPALFGQAETVVKPTSDFGEQLEQYNGLDASVKARLGPEAFFQGGLSVGRTATDSCFVEILRSRSTSAALRHHGRRVRR
jgi:hypothetical protein